MKIAHTFHGIALALACGLATSLEAQNLFVCYNTYMASSDDIGKYGLDGSTNNASLISGLNSANCMAIAGNDLYISYYPFAGATIGEYTTSGATVNASLLFFGVSDTIDGIAVSSAPQLNVATVGGQSVLFYPSWATNYVLVSVTNLASTNWTPIIGQTVTNNLPASFFQLQPAE